MKVEEESVFYQRLKELSKMKNKSINQVEKEIGYPRNALHNYKNANSPSALRAFELADYFSVTPEYLFGRKEKNRNQEWEI